MIRIVLNVLLLSILSLPCFLMFNDVDANGNWNYSLNIFGFLYSFWYYHDVLKKVFKI